MDLNNLVLFFILISFGLFFYKYFLLILNKYSLKLLIDDDLKKPQAFHEFPVSTSVEREYFFPFYNLLFPFIHFRSLLFLLLIALLGHLSRILFPLYFH